MGDRQYGISPKATKNIAKEIKKINDLDIQIALVIGAGNIFRGLSASQQGLERSTADYMGMLATIMNSLAMQEAMEKIGVDTRLQSAIQMKEIAEPFIRRRAIRHMEKGRVVILAAGTGSPYFTTDSGAALRALELNCEVLMKGTKVDGIYDKDPLKHKNAKHFDNVSYIKAISASGIQIMDTAAISLCMDNSIPIYVFNIYKPGNLTRAVTGNSVGTMVK